MLHEILSDYLEKVTQAILQCRDAYVERYVEEILTPERVNLRIRLRFDQGHLLEVNEAVVVEDNSLVSLDYRYHCQDKNNRLIFRYHKHLPDTVIPSDKPDIDKIIKEAEEARR